MALAFRVVRINFPTTTGRSQTVTGTATFSSTVRSAQTAINGFNIGYRDFDHHLLTVMIDNSDGLLFSGNLVTFSVNLLLRDSSGSIDDPYGGYVDVLVIADVA